MIAPDSVPKDPWKWHRIYGPYSLELGWVPAPRYLLRRALVLPILRQLQGSLLEVGCGSGALLAEASRLGLAVEALETSADARRLARLLSRRNVPIHQSARDEWTSSFDTVVAFEVLEHIDDDRAALSRWASWLRPDGYLLVSVPAHQRRWSPSDEWAGHFRRYEREDLANCARQAGLEVTSIDCYGFPLGNLVRPLRALLVGVPKESDGRQERTAQSGVERSVETRLFPLLASPLGKAVMGLGTFLQRKTLHREWGEGYLMVARRR